MKKVLLIIVLFIGVNSFAQDSLKWSKEGLNYIVVDVDNRTADELYNGVLSWINKSYINPKEVILTKTEGKHIRIQGYGDFIVAYVAGKKGVSSAKYMIEFDFKDNKYKLNVTSITSYSYGKYYDISTLIYKKNGDVKNMYRDTPKSIEEHFTKLNSDIFNSLTNGNKSTDEDW